MDIYDPYPPIQNKYYRWYMNICLSRQLLNRQKKKNDNFIKHHIIPDSFFIQRTRNKQTKDGWLLGKPNEKFNMVLLNDKEHFLCHLLITKCYTGLAKAKCVFAFQRMCNGNKTSLYYDHARKMYGENMIGSKNHMYGRKGKNSPVFGTIGFWKNKKHPESLKEKALVKKEKEWLIFDPVGNFYIVKGLKYFCLQNKLDVSCMIRVAQGKNSNHKNWINFKL